MSKRAIYYAQLFLRFTLAITMLSAVADRFGFWAKNSAWDNWENFEKYAAQLTFYRSPTLSKPAAYLVTFLEIILPVLLLAGFKLKWAAMATAVLLLLFALSMGIAVFRLSGMGRQRHRFYWPFNPEVQQHRIIPERLHN